MGAGGVQKVISDVFVFSIAGVVIQLHPVSFIHTSMLMKVGFFPTNLPKSLKLTT